MIVCRTAATHVHVQLIIDTLWYIPTSIQFWFINWNLELQRNRYFVGFAKLLLWSSYDRLLIERSFNDQIGSYSLKCVLSCVLFIPTRNGLRKCGLFCCAAYAIDKLTHEQEVDVMTSVKQIRRHRPEFIVSVAQYRCLYELVEYYVSSTGAYAENR